MARMMGKARSDHDEMQCCPGHDPGIHPKGVKLPGRRTQRSREAQRVHHEITEFLQDDTESWYCCVCLREHEAYEICWGDPLWKVVV